MTVRAATRADEPLLRELWQEFFEDGEGAPDWVEETWESNWERVGRWVDAGLVFVAAEDGFVIASAGEEHSRVGEIVDLYVRERARRGGLARALIEAAVTRMRELGCDQVTVAVGSRNDVAQAVYRSLGFAETMRVLMAPIDLVAAAAADTGGGETFGSVHVQTDDRRAVERAVANFLPRVGGSGGTHVTDARNGWVGVYDERCDREPPLLQRLAKELSDRLGAVVLAVGSENGVAWYALLERGSVMDEYHSVPSARGQLPPGDVIALAANPTVVARLTGAQPAMVRAVARTAERREDLPEPRALLGEFASVIGVAGIEAGYADVA